MKATDIIENKIARFPKGYVFTYSDFDAGEDKKEAIIKALNRMAASGRLSKVSKGKFYQSEVTVFGELQPDLNQLVKDLMENNGKITGYLTGFSTYNQLGLTTQVSNVIQIGKNDIRADLKRGRYAISFIKQKNTITKDNVFYLQILDAIRYIKKIPDTTIANALERIQTILGKFPVAEQQAIVKLSLKYPPVVRAILGMLLDRLGNTKLTEPLRKSLNPITVYKLGVAKDWTCAEKWNIR